MGQCCATPSDSQGEDYINNILSSENFYLKNFTYEEMKKKIESFPQKTNDFVRSEIMKIAYNNNKNKNKFIQAHEALIKEIFMDLPSVPTNNSILFWLFPFMNHRNEESEAILYELFKGECQDKFDLNGLREVLDSFVDNLTKKLTFVFWMSTTNSELRNEFDEMNATVYTSENVNKYIEMLIVGLKNYANSNEVISKEDFIKNFKSNHLYSYQDVRHAIYSKVGLN